MLRSGNSLEMDNGSRRVGRQCDVSALSNAVHGTTAGHRRFSLAPTEACAR